MTRLWAIAALTVAVVMACDRVPLTSPTGSTIVVTIDKDTLPLGGSATVIAVVTESAGTAVHNGTMVTFQPSIGRTDPVEAPTVNGKATVTFLAGSTSGAGVIHAFSGGARTGSGNSSAGGASVKVGTAGVERIGVRAEPLNVPVTGGTVVIIATLFDAAGNSIINTPITFSSDFGSLSSSIATTDANGEARVSLTTNRTTVVTVNAGAKSQPFTLQALSPPTITITCTGTTFNVGVPVSCTLKPQASGNSTSSAPIQNVTINWGDGSGERPIGVVTGDTVVAHTFTTPGVYQLTAAVTDTNSQRAVAVTSLNVTRAIPTISISGSAATAAVGATVTFTVTPPPAPLVPISGVVVQFGDGTGRNLGAVTAAQVVTKIYTSAGSYQVSATVTDTAGTSNTATTAIIITGATAPTVAFTQNGTISGGIGSFTVTPTAAAGTTISSVVVRRGIDNGGATVHSSTNGGTFAVNGLAVNDVLTATVTDSAGSTATAQVIVK